MLVLVTHALFSSADGPNLPAVVPVLVNSLMYV